MATSYTFSSGGKTYTATPTANTTAAQKAAVASNPAYTPVSSGGGSSSGYWTSGAIDPKTGVVGTGQFVQGQAPQSYVNQVNKTLGGSGLAVDSNLKTIPASSLGASTVPYNLPAKSPLGNVGNVAGSGNTGLNTLLQQYGYKTDAENQFQYTPKTTDTPTDVQVNQSFMDSLKTQLGMVPKKEDIMKSPEILAQNAQVEQRQQEVNNATSQLNTIIAKQNTDLLSHRKMVSDSGGTTTGFGGIEAEINRQAAIQALPIQASVAAAQGNLQLAQQHLDTLMKMKTEEVNNEYQYKSSLFNTISGTLNKMESYQLDKIKTQEERKYQEQQDLLKTQSTLLSSAAQQKAPSAIMSSIASAGTKQEAIIAAGVYGGDILGQQLKQAQLDAANKKTGTKFEIKTVNGMDMLFNPDTGALTPVSSSVAPGGADPVQKSIDQLSFLRDTAKQATDLSSGSGASWITKTLGDTFVGDTKFRQLEALTNTLKTNVLSLMTDPNVKKFFGPQMSNADVLLMTSAGTTLNPAANTPTQMKDEIKRLDDLFNRMQTAIKTGSTGSMNVITSPTGELIRITD